MSKLDEILSKKPQNTEKPDLRQKLNKSAFLNENTGMVPYMTNAINSINRGLTQVVETPYNIVNRAPQMVNLFPGEQGVGTLDEMGVPGFKQMGKDPLIDAVDAHYPGMGDVGGIKTSNPNYPKTSQFAEDVGIGVGSLGMTGLATALPGIAGKFASFLNAPVQAAPKAAVAGEVLAAGGAASGREIADRTDMGPIGSFMAEFLGSLGPGALMYSGPKIATGIFGREGGEEVLSAMERQGVRPSVGLTGNRAGAQLESGASALPFFSSVPENVRTKQFDQFSDALTDAADNVRPAGTGPLTNQVDLAEQVYDIAEGGANRMRGGFSSREEALVQAIGPQTPVDTSSVRAAIAAQMQSGDAKIRRALQKELDDLDAIADATTGAVPYENLRKWRSNFGSSIEDQGVLTGAKKQIYAGVTKDTEAVANAAGQGAEFKSLMADQSKAYADDVRLSEGGDLPQAGKLGDGQLERSRDFLKQAYANPDKMDYIKRNATPEQWNQLRANVAQDLGLAKAGAQDAAGDVISPNKFITEWNKMDPRVKNMLFDDNLGTRQTLDDLALIADAFKARGLEANTSRTAGTGMSAMGLKEVAGAAVGGAAAVKALPATIAASGITYATLKGLMSETLAKWAAGRTPTAVGTVGARVPGAAARAATEEDDGDHEYR